MDYPCKEVGCPQLVAEEDTYCAKCLVAGQQYTGPQDSSEGFPGARDERTACIRCRKDGLTLAPTGICGACAALESLSDTEIEEIAKPGKECVHCHKVKKIAARGLCWRCYNDNLIKKNYPASASNEPRTTVRKKEPKSKHEVKMMDGPSTIQLSEDLDKATARIEALEQELGRLSYSIVEDHKEDEVAVGGALIIYIEDERDLAVIKEAETVAKTTRRDVGSWILCLIEDTLKAQG